MAGGRLHTANELSLRFGVSIRTLYRDFELLSAWGLPIEALPGRDGGFRVIPGYAMDRSILGEGELAATAAAMGSIEAAVGDKASASAGVKLDALLGRLKARKSPWIRIALAPGGDERPLIDMLHESIEARRLVRFRYRDGEGRESERRVEPVAVAYLWQGWYLWAYCLLRKGWRLFKLSRIHTAKSLLERFELRAEPSEDAWRMEWEEDAGEKIRVRISPTALDRAQEYFGQNGKTAEADGSTIFDLRLPRNEWLYSFLLSYGDGLEVLEPSDILEELAVRAERIANLNRCEGKF